MQAPPRGTVDGPSTTRYSNSRRSGRTCRHHGCIFLHRLLVYQPTLCSWGSRGPEGHRFETASGASRLSECQRLERYRRWCTNLIREIVKRRIAVCPTLAGSSYSVVKMLRAPELLYTDPDLITNVDASIRKRLYLALRFLRLPGVPRVLMGQDRAMERWELCRRESLSNTRRL